MKLLCIDGNSILNRAFYGIKALSTKSGIPTNALVGFLNILLRLRSDVEPDAVVAAFDLAAPTFRHKQYDAYKAGRKGMPDELAEQLPVMKDILTLMGYHVVEKEGFEADDILGTFARLCTESGDTCTLATGDRDSLQLVSEQVTVRLATTRETIVYDPAKIHEVYGIEPKQLIEVKALMGDSSDNIPGVKGIGEKTALALIQEFHDLDGVYAHLDSESIKPRIRNLLEQERETAYMSRELATIVCDVPVGNTADYLSVPPDAAALVEKLASLEMFTMIDKLGLSEASVPAIPAEEAVEVPIAHNPDMAQTAEQLASLPTVDFLADFAGGELSVLRISLGDSCAVYNYNADAAFEFLVLGAKQPKRTAGAKTVYRYLLDHGLEIEGLRLDTELAGYLLDSGGKGYGLDLLRKTYLPGCAIESEDSDIACLTPLCDKLESELEQKNLTDLLREIELPFSRVLAGLELTGFMIDRDGVREFGKTLELGIEQLTAEIHALAGEAFNPNSSQQLADILFNKLQLPAKKKTKTGYSTNSEVLESLADRHPIIPLILEYRKLTKLNSTYVIGLLKAADENGRIHSIFKQTEARTGRISSTEPNMQNIPVRTELGREMRRFFIAKKGYTLIDADYSQIELRILAHIADDQNMIEAFKRGDDIHQMTASQVFHLPLEDVPAELRSRSKAINFGIVYGISAFSLSKDIGVSVAEAAHYIDEYLNTYSGVKRYMQQSVAFGKEHGYVETLYHRRRDLPELKSSNHNLRSFGERAAMNTPIQGTAADIIKIAMIRVADRLERDRLDAKIILQVHDEILIEAEQSCAEKVRQALKEEMENAASLRVPLKVDVGVGETWYESK